jgi:AcrR family transcriptional regulator
MATQRRTSRATAAGTRGADDKRAAILAAAFTLFSRYGYRRTSIEEVARTAGIAKGTVYLYFRTKEEIFRALSQASIDRVREGATAAAAAPGPVGERLRAILEAKFGYFHALLAESPHANELLDSKSRVSADLFQQAERAYQRILARTIADATARGELAPARTGLTPEGAAALLMGSAHGLSVGTEAPPTGRLLRRQLDDLVRLLVAGLGGTQRSAA